MEYCAKSFVLSTCVTERFKCGVWLQGAPFKGGG